MRGRKYTSQNREKYGTLERNQTAAERAAENKSEKNVRGMKMDGKNREEQENGAKVRDLEEYKAENRKRKRRRRITVGILAGAILAAGIGTGVWLQLRTFQGYDTVQATETEDTDTYMFQKSGNKIVRYGIDGIELRDRKNQTLWSAHYTMENPQMISCGDAIAIYDKNGTKIVVYDADGKAGEITASYPIVKASVAGQGVVAAILENNGESWIKYYNTNGDRLLSPEHGQPGLSDGSLTFRGRTLDGGFLRLRRRRQDEIAGRFLQFRKQGRGSGGQSCKLIELHRYAVPADRNRGNILMGCLL